MLNKLFFELNLKYPLSQLSRQKRSSLTGLSTHRASPFPRQNLNLQLPGFQSDKMLGSFTAPLLLAEKALSHKAQCLNALLTATSGQERPINFPATDYLINELFNGIKRHPPSSDSRSRNPERGSPEFSSFPKVSKQGLHGTTPRTVLSPPPPASDGDSERSREIPRLLFVQNPLTWFTVKMNFRLLRRSWDPDFVEAEFQRGTKHAVARITELVHRGDFENLEPLMTAGGLARLRRDADLWEGSVKNNLRLAANDIQLVIPRKINLIRVIDKKICDVDVVFIALKWMERNRLNHRSDASDLLLYIDLIARFHRDYSKGNDSDWTVSAFRLRKFNTLES